MKSLVLMVVLSIMTDDHSTATSKRVLLCHCNNSTIRRACCLYLQKAAQHNCQGNWRSSSLHAALREHSGHHSLRSGATSMELSEVSVQPLFRIILNPAGELCRLLVSKLAITSTELSSHPPSPACSLCPRAGNEGAELSSRPQLPCLLPLSFDRE